MDDLSGLTKSYVTPPQTLPGFPKANRATPKTPMGGGKKRKRWINDDGDILEWDYQHGKIERYNKRGKHKGEFDPDTGDQTKPADPTRTVTPTIWKSRTKKMHFHVAWYDKVSSELVGDIRLENATADSIREAFDLKSDEYPGDCLGVTEAHLPWIVQHIPLSIDLDDYDYFVEACTE